jgi:UDP-glucuronate 4-epimerase
MNILITGGAGFIGSKIAQTLIDRGDRVIIIDNFNDYYDPQLKRDRVKYLLGDREYGMYEGDIRDEKLVEKIFATEAIDKVVHLAAMAGVRNSIKDPLLYQDVNVRGTMVLLEAARKRPVANFVYASSSSVYGNNTKVPFSETDFVDHPISPYAATKKSTELLAHTYSHLFSVPTTGLRFFTVYGPWGRPDMALFSFVKHIFEDKPIDVFNNGKMSRNFTFIDDIVSGTITVLDADLAGGEVMNIGGDREETLLRFIEVIETCVGKEAKKNFLPMQPGDVPKTVADISKLRALGWEPQTRIEEGIEAFVNWYRGYYKP